jgi:hypothetical protein
MMKVYFAILKTHLEGKKWIRQFVKIFNFKTHLQDDAYYYYFCFHQVWWDLLFLSSPPLFHTVCNLNDGLKWQFTQIERLKDSIGLNKNLLENQSRYPRAIAHPSTVKVELIAKLKLTFFQDWKLGTRFWQKLFKSVLTKGLF